MGGEGRCLAPDVCDELRDGGCGGVDAEALVAKLLGWVPPHLRTRIVAVQVQVALVQLRADGILLRDWIQGPPALHSCAGAPG